MTGRSAALSLRVFASVDTDPFLQEDGETMKNLVGVENDPTSCVQWNAT